MFGWLKKLFKSQPEEKETCKDMREFWAGYDWCAGQLLRGLIRPAYVAAMLREGKHTASFYGGALAAGRAFASLNFQKKEFSK